MKQKKHSIGVSFVILLFTFGFTVAFNSAIGAPPEKVDVLIRFTKVPEAAEIGMVKRHGGTVSRSFTIVPAVAARIPAVALEKMRKEQNVAVVEIDGTVKGHDINNTWGVKRIGCGGLHDGSFDGSSVPETGLNVRVAVIDSGVDYGHPELTTSYAGGFDFVNNDSDPFDDNGHGTHVAGTVVAARNGVGVVGAAPGASLYAIKVLGADGSGSWSWIIGALDWCVSNGIQVANLSLGSASDPGSTVAAAFNNAEAAGVVIVSSAGNAGEGADTVGYPAKYSSVIAVASTTSSDTRSSFSSTGPAVEIAAPGSSIYSTVIGGGYGYASGTSMASPHVAGVAALLIASGVADANNDGHINDDVRGLLNSTADDLGVAGTDQYFGSGLVNAETAVLLSKTFGGGDPAPVFDAPSQLNASVSSTTVTLNWTDNANVEDGFEVQYGTKSKGRVTWNSWGTVGKDATAFTGSLGSGTYLFRARAFQNNPSAVTDWSQQIQADVIDTASGGGGGGGKKPRR